MIHSTLASKSVAILAGLLALPAAAMDGGELSRKSQQRRGPEPRRRARNTFAPACGGQSGYDRSPEDVIFENKRPA
jgi:hypothetical protein